MRRAYQRFTTFVIPSIRSGLLLAALTLSVQIEPSVGWAAPGKKADEAKLKEAEELKERYEKLLGEGKYAEGIPLAEKACSILEKELGRRSVEFAECLNDWAVLYRNQGEYENAEPLYERALAIRRKALGPDHPDVAESLNNLAVLYKHQGKYGTAEPLHERALAIREKSLGPDHPDVAESLNNLAGLYRDQGEYEKAEPLYERALAIREKALGHNHLDVAKSLNSLAGLYADQGKYGRAELLYERALAIREKALDHDHLHVAVSLNDLATLYADQGEYGKAEPLAERALAIQEKSLGHEHPNVAGGLNNLANQYAGQGEYGKAEPLYERALAIQEKALGHDHLRVAGSLDNSASLYASQGEYGRAEPMYERALAIREKALGHDHVHVARSLNNLAFLYNKQGEFAKAQPLLERALTIREKALGPDHPLVATSLNNLAFLYDEQGEFAKAHPLYERVLSIREKALGPNHPDAKSLESLARIDIKLERYDSAVKLQNRALDVEYKNLGRSLLFAEERRRLDYAATISGALDYALSAHLQAVPDHTPSAELALTTLLRRKGLLLDLGARSAATIRRTLPEEHHHLLDELSVTRDRYTALSNRGPGPLTIERFAEQLAEIQQEQHRLWRDIAEYSPIVETISKPVSIVDIQRSLPPKGVLIEYIRYFPKYHEKAPGTPAAPRYAAYLVFPDRFTWVDLGLAETIEKEATTFRRALVGKTAVSSALHDLVMAPVLERLGEADTLFIAPDTALNLIPFAALHDGERYLVERYPLHTLTTGRDLMHPWDTGATAGQAVVVVANPTGAKLPGTEREAKLLGELFPYAETLLHDAATEAGVQHHTQPWLIHLATHGFFEVPDRDPKLEAAMAEYQQSMSPSAMQFAPGRIDNPMQHAGLLLAPAAPTTPTTPNDSEADDETEPEADDAHTADGRLTAYEVSGWDLRGTELVVLSACGTGLGDVKAGEGVFGLRRAFAMAGVQTQVMSLWSVPDSTTATLMNAYYRKLLAGKGRGEAMREVQLEMLRSPDHRHPGDWASFVVVGDWGPLSAERLPPGPEGPPAVERGCGCQRASIGGDEQPGAMLLLGLLALLSRRRGPHGGTSNRGRRVAR